MSDHDERPPHRAAPDEAAGRPARGQHRPAPGRAEAGARDHAAGRDQDQDQDQHQDRGDKDQDARAGQGKDGGQHEEGERADEPRRSSKKPLIILAVAVVLLALIAFIWWFATRNEVTTDDAYTDGNAVTIAPKVGGYVVALKVNDNVYVHRGDVLLEIDPRDYQAQVDQADAQLGLAQAQLAAAQVQLDIARVQYPEQYRQARAQVLAAQASLTQARAAAARQHAVDPRATSQQNVDTANAQLQSARAGVAQTEAQAKTASLQAQQIQQAEVTVEARRQQVRQAQAQLEQARLNLSYCEVRAPSDGYITRRNVNLGSLLQPGASLFSIVTPQVWVTANFKESQLARMRPGDKVDVEVDAYPDLVLHGHVDSVQLGTGSRFSAFPAENATGNFVKIVQRVPVKIVIDRGIDPHHPLPLGLSVQPKVYLQ